jgi:hypothetical protein
MRSLPPRSNVIGTASPPIAVPRNKVTCRHQRSKFQICLVSIGRVFDTRWRWGGVRVHCFLAFAAGDPKLVARRAWGKNHPASPRASFKSPSWLSNPTRRARQIGARSFVAFRTGDRNDGQNTSVSHHTVLPRKSLSSSAKRSENPNGTSCAASKRG